jgi:hypothetical protein
METEAHSLARAATGVSRLPQSRTEPRSICASFSASVREAFEIAREEKLRCTLTHRRTLSSTQAFPGFDRTHLLPDADMTPAEAGGNMIFCASVSIS